MTPISLRRIIPRFSLRTLVIFLLLVTSAMGLWWHWEAWYLASSESRVAEELPGRSVLRGWTWPRPDVTFRVSLSGLRVNNLQALAADGETVLASFPLEQGAFRESERDPRFRRGAPVVYAVCRDGTRMVLEDTLGGVYLCDIKAPSLKRLPFYTGERRIDGLHFMAAFSPDGSRLAVGHSTRWGGHLGLWDAATGELVHDLTGKDLEWRGARVLGWSPDGTRLIAAGFERVCLWDAASGRRLLDLGERFDHVEGCEISPDGSRILTTENSGTTRMWDIATGRCLASMISRRNPKGTLSGGVTRGEFLTDDTVVVAHDAWTDGDAPFSFKAGTWRRRRPEWWWGVFYLKELWATVLFAGLLVWSILRDRRALGAPEAPEAPAP